MQHTTAHFASLCSVLLLQQMDFAPLIHPHLLHAFLWKELDICSLLRTILLLAYSTQVCDKGAGSAMLLRPKRMEEVARAADMSMSM